MFDHKVPGIANEPEDTNLIERDENVVSISRSKKPDTDDVSWLLQMNSVQELRLKEEKKRIKRLKATIKSKDETIAELESHLKYALAHGGLRTRFSLKDLAYRTAWISVPVISCGAGLSLFFI